MNCISSNVQIFLFFLRDVTKKNRKVFKEVRKNQHILTNSLKYGISNKTIQLIYD